MLDGVVQIHEDIWEALTDGLPVVATSHVRLDGDGAGSVLALCHALRARGVEAIHYFEPPTPPMFDFLDGMTDCCTDPAQLPDSYVLAVIDCGNMGRVGEQGDRLTGRVRTVNIDHHRTNTGFGDVNYVDPDASSCGEMIYRLLSTVGVPMTPQIAECLFSAIVTDTGQFSHQDTSPASLAICAECMEAGADAHRLTGLLFQSPTREQVRLRHLALGTLQFHDGGRVATMTITRDMFDRTGLGPIDTEGFAEVPITVQGVLASALLKEMPGCDDIKVSMRSRESVDVCAVARSFGGGGHMHAAGCEIDDSLENARQIIAGQLKNRLPDDPSD